MSHLCCFDYSSDPCVDLLDLFLRRTHGQLIFSVVLGVLAQRYLSPLREGIFTITLLIFFDLSLDSRSLGLVLTAGGATPHISLGTDKN